ncbi:MAG: BON domain-containing protein [Chloroflexota bacterium]
MVNYSYGPCPTCGLPMSVPMQPQGFYGFNPMWGSPYAFGPGLGIGTMGTMPGTYLTAYGGPGIASDDQIKDMVLTALDADPRIPFDSDISVDVTGGIVTLSGTVPNKRIKHAAGDDAWWIPDVVDINNELQVTGRRRGMARGSSEETL